MWVSGRTDFIFKWSRCASEHLAPNINLDKQNGLWFIGRESIKKYLHLEIITAKHTIKKPHSNSREYYIACASICRSLSNVSLVKFNVRPCHFFLSFLHYHFYRFMIPLFGLWNINTYYKPILSLSKIFPMFRLQ